MFINLLVAAVLDGAPLLYGTVGEIIDQKVGQLNLGVEGMMAMGACAGFMAGYLTDSIWMAIFGAFFAGAMGALIYAVLTVTLMANQNVTGLTLTIFGVGLCNFVGEFMIARSDQGTLKLPEHVNSQLAGIHIPGLSDLPVFGKLLFSYNLFVYLGIVIAVLAGIYLNRTHLGRNIRAIGENPAAADAAGIPVVRYKYLNLLLGGGICGIGGAYISLIINGGVWKNNSTGGFGWISVALVIFAMWSPVRAILGAFAFGLFRMLRFYVPKSLVPVPDAIYDMLPYFITACVLVITSIQQSRENSQPAACGQNYFREER